MLNIKAPGSALSIAKTLISPTSSGGLGWLEGSSSLRSSRGSLTLLWSSALSTGVGKTTLLPPEGKTIHQSSALQGTPCLGADLGQVAAKCCRDQGGRQLLFLCSCSYSISSMVAGGAVKDWQRKHPLNQHCSCLISLLSGRKCMC